MKVLVSTTRMLLFESSQHHTDSYIIINTMADEEPQVSFTEPQARHVLYCGGKTVQIYLSCLD